MSLGSHAVKKIADPQLADIRATQDANHRYNLLIRMPSTHQTAHNAQVKEAAGLFHEYAFKALPDVDEVATGELLSHQPYGPGVEQVLGPGRRLVGWPSDRNVIPSGSNTCGKIHEISTVTIPGTIAAIVSTRDRPG